MSEGAQMLDAKAFRDALGRFPTGVTIVTAPGIDSDPVAITVSSFNSVSLDPPLVLFSVARTARSLELLRRASDLCVNVLREDQWEISGRFARAMTKQWAGVDHRLNDRGCPAIHGAVAVFECTPHAHHDGGDHVIFVARVRRFEVADGGAPLVFFRGGYRALSTGAA